MTPTDQDLAGLVARDIEQYLHTVQVNGPVFGIAVWADEGYSAEDATAGYGISIGTDTDLDLLRAAPAHRDLSDERWYRWPASERWNTGNWPHVVGGLPPPRHRTGTGTAAGADPRRGRRGGG